MAMRTSSDPLLDPSDLPYQLPRFDQIATAHFRPAIERSMAEQREAITAITNNPEPPSFENTLVALELSGARLSRAMRIFSNLASADADREIETVETELAPQLAAHQDAILLDADLHSRICAVADSSVDLDPESRYLLERYLTWFRLAGAELDAAGKTRLSEINARISTLQTDFKIRLQADTNDLALVIEDPGALEGLSPAELSAARQAAEERGLTDRFLISLVLPTAHPWLASLSDRQTRVALHDAQRARGSRANEYDTRAIALELVRLRAERAALLGFESHAAVVTADSAAKNPEAVRELLVGLAPAAARNARAERARLEAAAGGPVSAADWPYYSERVRASELDLDLALLRPYFEFERVLRDGVFYAASRLFGLVFSERSDLAGYHPDVRVFEVTEEDGAQVGLYLLDLYTRETKRGGAWMNSLVDAASLTGTVTAVVVNNLNVSKPASGESTLLSFEETQTLFHEFGHALHGLLGRSRYPELSGTNVFTDFVEFPSQLNEMWLLWPETLSNFAVHHLSGEPISTEVIDRLRAAQTFNEGHATSEYLAAALIDFAWHSLSPEMVPTDVDEIETFEAAVLAAAGLENPAVPPRYLSAYFAHIFAGGYAAGYYSYIWAEMLDADTSEWLAAHGGLTRENGEALRRHVLGFGGTREPLAAYTEWRGRPAPLEPLLKRRGLDSDG